MPGKSWVRCYGEILNEYPIVTTTYIVYPERLLIYHAGTGKTVFIGCLKITTIFLFSFSCLVIAPSFYYDPQEPSWIAAAGLFLVFHIKKIVR